MLMRQLEGKSQVENERGILAGTGIAEMGKYACNSLQGTVADVLKVPHAGQIGTRTCSGDLLLYHVHEEQKRRI